MAKSYKVSVQTGDVNLAGTDADVFITIYGKSGISSKERLLDNAANNFEKGDLDHFTLQVVDLGDLKSIYIRHDNSGIGPGWFLDNVRITDQSTGNTWTFPCNCWLARDEGDGRIARTISAA